jgi:hypothetical protein
MGGRAFRRAARVPRGGPLSRGLGLPGAPTCAQGTPQKSSMIIPKKRVRRDAEGADLKHIPASHEQIPRVVRESPRGETHSDYATKSESQRFEMNAALIS